jgi:hypothetical protein
VLGKDEQRVGKLIGSVLGSRSGSILCDPGQVHSMEGPLICNRRVSEYGENGICQKKECFMLIAEI